MDHQIRVNCGRKSIKQGTFSTLRLWVMVFYIRIMSNSSHRLSRQKPGQPPCPKPLSLAQPRSQAARRSNPEVVSIPLQRHRTGGEYEKVMENQICKPSCNRVIGMRNQGGNVIKGMAWLNPENLPRHTPMYTSMIEKTTIRSVCQFSWGSQPGRGRVACIYSKHAHPWPQLGSHGRHGQGHHLGYVPC